MSTHKGNILLPLISAVAVLALLAAGYFFYQNQQLKQGSSNNTPSPSPAPTTQDETANWKIYSNPELRFSIEYPPTMKISQEPKPFKDGKQNTHWSLSLDDRGENDQSGTSIKTSVTVQFSQNPISGESNLPITRIQDTFLANDNTEFFDIQGNDAVKLKSVYSSNQTSITIHILKDRSLWSIDGSTTSTNKESVKLIDQILSTFKFQ